MIPFFVADRPMSLRILRALPLHEYPSVRIGIMAHANTTSNFQAIFSDYPWIDSHSRSKGDGPFRKKQLDYIAAHTIKMCDSGIFTREGATLTYDELFRAYANMGVEFGIMIDVFRDSPATVRSAQDALRAYYPFRQKFKLVGVAQGESLEEYLNCYNQLKELGFDYIAIGGLLRRREKTARYVNIRSEDFMLQILGKLRQAYPDAWLFALGCFHPSRLVALKELGVWADYKGWIFQYKKRNEFLNSRIKVFAENHLVHIGSTTIDDGINHLRQLSSQRSTLIAEQQELSARLLDGRRAVRADISALYDELVAHDSTLAAALQPLCTRAQLDKWEQKIVSLALDYLGKKESEESILANVRLNRELNKQIKNIEKRVNLLNLQLAKAISDVDLADVDLPEDSESVAQEIVSIINKSEQDYRFEQVLEAIQVEVLAAL